MPKLRLPDNIDIDDLQDLDTGRNFMKLKKKKDLKPDKKEMSEENVRTTESS